MKKTLLLLISFLLLRLITFADEGMWIPLFLKQLNESTMKERGMKISAEDIYSVNKSSLKDAVVIFGSGCTGEIISDKGLLLTNHHCSVSQIQSLSAVGKNYLKNGYWSYSMEEELACQGLTATFIIRIEDVTTAVLKELSPVMTETERDIKIKEVAKTLEKDATKGSHYTASVKPFYNGNQFFMMIMETFKDVRLVGTPPNSIGNFGGDTDNWMWPRHTGDFSLFRIYAGKDNKPAAYSKDNIPYTPKYSLPISIKGIEPGDFTMVFGFPGKTTRYIPSYAVKNSIEINNPARIKIRTERLEIMDAAMRSDEKLSIQYASKYRRLANGWKKWQGELNGLKRLNTLSDKQEEEKAFADWVVKNNKKEYRSLLQDFEKAYSELGSISNSVDYINECAYGVEIINYAVAFNKLATLAGSKPADEAAIKTEAERISNGAGGFFRDFDLITDKKLFVSMMNLYFDDVDKMHHPKLLTDIHTKHKGDFSKYADELYTKSAFADSVKIRALLADFSPKNLKRLLNDPAFILAMSFRDTYKSKLEILFSKLNNELTILNRNYMAAQMEMHSGKTFYPDANSTLRVAFGQVNGYKPRDGVQYDYYTTLGGVIEKEDNTIEEFEVSAKLKELYAKKDYGDYAYKGELPVAFVASNHTTGGNSGSPVINANGELIGTNFDRVWEGTMSDIDFDPTVCRNISLDIRFTLFVIEKYAGCKRLIDEMRIVK